jgi:hypothetical protein
VYSPLVFWICVRLRESAAIPLVSSASTRWIFGTDLPELGHAIVFLLIPIHLSHA